MEYEAYPPPRTAHAAKLLQFCIEEGCTPDGRYRDDDPRERTWPATETNPIITNIKERPW